MICRPRSQPPGEQLERTGAARMPRVDVAGAAALADRAERRHREEREERRVGLRRAGR